MASAIDEIEIESILAVFLTDCALSVQRRRRRWMWPREEDRTIKCSSRIADFGRGCGQESFAVTQAGEVAVESFSRDGETLDEPWQRPFGVIGDFAFQGDWD